MLALADDVQFLVRTQPEPGAGKCERRPRNRRELQYVAIKLHRSLDVGDVNGNVVKLGDVQVEWAGEQSVVSGWVVIQWLREGYRKMGYRKMIADARRLRFNGERPQ